MKNERGIALIVTLMVVAILTIIVVEFTYSVQIDAHMARNALNGLQASLLARSGINLGEAVLLHDDNIKFDAYTEDWGDPEQLNSQFILPDNMRLRVQIIDEGGKLNLNLTRPRTPFEWRQAQNPDNTNPPMFKRWTAAAGNLLEQRGGSGQVADAIGEYWNQLFQILVQSPAGQPGQAAQASGTPTPGTNPVTNPSQWDFPSLDDASVIPGLTPALVRRARSVLTALDFRQPPKVNVNTAPPEVLGAIIPDAGVVDNIISQRQDQGLTVEDLRGLLDGMGRDPANNYVTNMLGVTSNFFLIRASATVNPNPLTGKGGISRSASMLVYRRQVPCNPPKSPPTVPCWTLAQLDWQKEGGAALLEQGSEQDPGIDDPLHMGLPGMGGN